MEDGEVESPVSRGAGELSIRWGRVLSNSHTPFPLSPFHHPPSHLRSTGTNCRPSPSYPPSLTAWADYWQTCRNDGCRYASNLLVPLFPPQWCAVKHHIPPIHRSAQSIIACTIRRRCWALMPVWRSIASDLRLHDSMCLSARGNVQDRWRPSMAPDVPGLQLCLGSLLHRQHRCYRLLLERWLLAYITVTTHPRSLAMSSDTSTSSSWSCDFLVRALCRSCQLKLTIYYRHE